MQVGQDRLAQGVRDENDNCIAKSGHGPGEGEGILVLDSDEITAFQVRGQSRQFCLQGLNRIEVSSGQTQSASSGCLLASGLWAPAGSTASRYQAPSARRRWCGSTVRARVLPERAET